MNKQMYIIKDISQDVFIKIIGSRNGEHIWGEVLNKNEATALDWNRCENMVTEINRTMRLEDSSKRYEITYK